MTGFLNPRPLPFLWKRLRESKAEEGCVWSRYAIIIQRRIIKLFNSAKKDVIRRHRAAVSNIIVGFLQIDFFSCDFEGCFRHDNHKDNKGEKVDRKYFETDKIAEKAEERGINVEPT